MSEGATQEDAGPKGGPGEAAPLLEARQARLATESGLRGPPLTLSTQGDRVVLSGDGSLLVGVLTEIPIASEGAEAESVVRLMGGALRVMGQDVGRGDHRSVLGVLPASPVMPPDMTARDFLRWTARLATGRRRGASTLAEAALQRLALTALAKRRIGTLTVTERRGVALAAAVLGDPPALLLDHPLHGLDEPGQTWVMTALRELASRHRLIVAVPHLATEGPLGELARAASDILVLRDGEVVARDVPRGLVAEARAFTVTVNRGAEALAARLAEDGIALRGGPLHFAVRLAPPQGPRDLLRAAHETGAVVVACVPLLG